MSRRRNRKSSSRRKKRSKRSGKSRKKRRRKRRRRNKKGSSRANKKRRRKRPKRKSRRSNRDKRSRDPNMMNVDREQPDAEDYLIGDGTPSQFAEDPHPGPYSDTADNEIGMPEHSEWNRDPNEWNSDEPYDNQGPDRNRTSRQALVDEYSKKAHRVIRIAERIVGEDAPDEVVEEQAFDLMAMPDRAVSSTLDRIGEDMDESDEQGETIHDAEEGEEDDHDEDGEDKESRTASNDEVLDAIGDVVGDRQASERETLRDVVSNSSEMDEARQAQQIDELANPNGGSATNSNDDNLDVDLTSAYQMDEFDEDDMQPEENLQAVLSENVSDREADEKDGVKSLGTVKEATSGRGKQASETEQLSKLWEQGPDVSGRFDG